MDSQADRSGNGADPRELSLDPGLRASDAERDRIALLLGEALADGRLTTAEHAQRVDLAYAARTRAELVLLTDDLPAPGGWPAKAPGGTGRPARIVAVFGGTTRRGTWQIPPATTIVTVFGGATIDLRDAVLPGQLIEVRAVAVFGAVSIIIPGHMRVADSGTAVFAGRSIPGDSLESQGQDAPVLRLRGACVFGSVSIRRGL